MTSDPNSLIKILEKECSVFESEAGKCLTLYRDYGNELNLADENYFSRQG